MSTSHDTRNPSGRWTPEQIRAEQEAVDFIARVLAVADLLDVQTYNEFGHVTRWLLMPVGYAELEFLTAFRSDHEDREDGADTEESGDEHEPELGSTQQTDQERAWGVERVRGRSKRLLPAFHVKDCDEPSLGSLGSCVTADSADQGQWSHHCGGPLDAEHDTADDEPSLGTTNGIDQSEWQGATSDLELDDSDHEPDDRGDLSFGATTPDESPPRQVRRSPRKSKRHGAVTISRAPLPVFAAADK